MTKSSRRRRATAALRFKQLLAASFCVVSIWGGSLAWGDGPSQGIVNRYVKPAAKPAATVAPQDEISVRQANGEQLLPQAEALLGPITRGGGGPFALNAEEIGG